MKFILSSIHWSHQHCPSEACAQRFSVLKIFVGVFSVVCSQRSTPSCHTKSQMFAFRMSISVRLHRCCFQLLFFVLGFQLRAQNNCLDQKHIENQDVFSGVCSRVSTLRRHTQSHMAALRISKSVIPHQWCSWLPFPILGFKFNAQSKHIVEKRNGNFFVLKNLKTQEFQRFQNDLNRPEHIPGAVRTWN